MKRFVLFAAILSVLVAGGFATSAQEAESTPEAQLQTEVASPCEAPQANVVATIGMIADVAQNIAGDCIEVIALMGAGVDPHLYTATERDVETLFEADMILYSGLNLEARLTDVFVQIREGMGKPTIPVSESIPEEFLLVSAAYDAPDPHVWMNVRLWMFVAEATRDGLIELLPEHEAYFSANAEAYLAEMQTLDEYVQAQITRIPEQQRILVTAHDAFQYYSQAYGIEVYAPQGITTESEVGVQDIRDTISVLIARQVPSIFVETSVSPDVIEAIIAGARAQGLAVEIGGTLYSDAMGDAGTYEGTYLGMIHSNTDTIVGGLLGSESE